MGRVLSITLTAQEESDLGGWVNFLRANPQYIGVPTPAVHGPLITWQTRIVLQDQSRARFDEIAAQFPAAVMPPAQPPAPPPVIGALWSGAREPIRDYPGLHFDAPFYGAVCYCYRFVVAQPPYINAAPQLRGGVAIQPDFRATVLCKLSETPYDLDGWQGEQGPANGAWNYELPWNEAYYAGRTLYLNFAIGRGFGDHTLRVEVMQPTHGVRDANT